MMRGEIKIPRHLLLVFFYVLGVIFVSIFLEKPFEAFAVKQERPPQSVYPSSMDPPSQPQEDAKTPPPSDPSSLSKASPAISPPIVNPGGSNDLPNLGENSPTSLQLIALMTEDAQPLEKGVLWRVFTDDGTEAPPSQPLLTDRSASPILQLKPGNYIINVAFGRAHLTRPITVTGASDTNPIVEKFVLNAGGLRVNALLSGKAAPPGSVSYSIYTDRDQSDERKLIVAGAKIGTVLRLNAGIYYIESIYGDANAAVRSDVTVEAGKLTEVNIAHSFANISFKLVTTSGGDALPNTRWSIQTPDGTVVKDSVGALPSHTLAPGTYTVIARHQDKAFKKEFKVQDGHNEEIELILQ